MSDPFVIGSYIATYGLIVGYAVSLVVRIRLAQRRG